METVTSLGPLVNIFGRDRIFTSRRVDAMVRPTRHLSIGDNSSPKHAQAKPSKHCRSVGAVGRKSKHYDPRCSLECRRAWAWKESLLMTRHLERLPGHVAKYAGTLNVFGLVELVDVLAIYRAFQNGIRKRFGNSVQLRPVTEIGPRCGRVHVHYAMTSDGVEVTKADVSELWRDASGGRRIQVDHKPIEDIPTWSRYMFKAELKYHEPGNPDCVVLFAKGSPRLPQGTRDFFPAKVKAALWEEWRAERHPSSESSDVRETLGKHSDSEGVETGSGTAVPPNNPTTDVRDEPTTDVVVNTRKSRVKNRALTGQFRAAWIRSERRPGHRESRPVSRRMPSELRSDHREKRRLSHRMPSNVRSIQPTAECRLAGLLSPLARPP
jgi:hypothetical protein